MLCHIICVKKNLKGFEVQIVYLYSKYIIKVFLWVDIVFLKGLYTLV